MYHILLVEDHRTIAETIKKVLTKQYYTVSIAYSASEAREKMQEYHFDLIILDWMLGYDMDGGLSLCMEIRKKSNLPILFLTAKSEHINTIEALDAGADDFIRKPFSLKELVARVEALFRRSQHQAAPVSHLFYSHGICWNTKEMTFRENTNSLHLPRKEYQLLSALWEAKGAVVPLPVFIEKLWGDRERNISSNLINVHLKNLRSHLGRHKNGIKTLRGVGIRWEFPISQ